MRIMWGEWLKSDLCICSLAARQKCRAWSLFSSFFLWPILRKTAAQMTLCEKIALVPGDDPYPWSMVLGPWIEN
jgi:hypothetical protein